MKLTSTYPVLMVENVPTLAQFLKDEFDFVAAFELDWYAHLTHPQNAHFNIGLVQRDHPTIPTGRQHQGLPAAGLLLNFEVEDVDALYVRMKDGPYKMLLPVKSEEFGQRHFILEGPEGILIDVIRPIAPNAEFAEAYSDEALPA